VGALALTKTGVTFNRIGAVHAVAVLALLRLHHARAPVVWLHKVTTAATVRQWEMEQQRVVAVAVALVLSVLLALH
jgi:hypothetical protein